MSNETAVVIKKADAPAQWGSREEVGALAQRFATMLPNSKDFDRNELMAIAQYCVMADVNPFRGEVYFYKDRGKLQMVDGYKILVRWAKDQDPYQDRDEDLPRAEDQAEHVRVWILKDADRHKIKEWTDLGAPWRDAFEMVATYADGVVTTAEANRQPPTGWTWRQVARKRALKNVLNLSHGAPSPQEMAQYRMIVNGVSTIPADWEGAEELSNSEAEQLAELRAKTRQHQQEQAALTFEERQDQFAENVRLMRGDPDFEGFDPAPEPPRGPDYDSVPDQDAAAPKTNGHNTTRPLDAERVRQVVRQKAGWHGNSRLLDGEPITDKQVGFVSGLMENALPNLAGDIAKKARHQILAYLWTVDSSTRLTKAEASATIDWLVNPDKMNEVNGYAEAEVAGILQAIALEAGQQELPL